MAILPMKRILICGMKKDRKEVLEFLQRQGVVEITSPAAQDDVFTSTDMTSSSVQFSSTSSAVIVFFIDLYLLQSWLEYVALLLIFIIHETCSTVYMHTKRPYRVIWSCLFT